MSIQNNKHSPRTHIGDIHIAYYLVLLTGDTKSLPWDPLHAKQVCAIKL